jgi:hypothetical protein
MRDRGHGRVCGERVNVNAAEKGVAIMFHRTSWVFDGMSHVDLEVEAGIGLEASVGGGGINLFIKEEGTNQRAKFILGGFTAGLALDANPLPFSGSFSTESMQSWGSHVYKGPASSCVSAETFAGPVIVQSVAAGLIADTDVKVFAFLAMNSYTSVSRFLLASSCGPFGSAAGTVSNIEAAMVAGGSGFQAIAGVELQAGIFYATFRGISYPPGSSSRREFNALTRDQRNLAFMSESQIYQRWGSGSGARVLSYRNHLREQFPNYEQYSR